MRLVRRPMATLLAAALLAGCGGSESATPQPAATEAPVPTEAGPAATDPPIGFAPDSIISVVAGPLRVRSKPSVEDDSVKFTPLLDSGQKLFVISGPVQGSGYDWYLARTVDDRVTQDGWVAVQSRDGIPWMEPAAIGCPPATLSDMARMDGAVRLHCFGSRDISFTTTLYAGATCDGTSQIADPTWLSDCQWTFRWGSKMSDVIVAVPPSLIDAVGAHAAGDAIKATVVAHMDDPVAQTCHPKSGLDVDPVILAASVILDCRTVFVATTFERQ